MGALWKDRETSDLTLNYSGILWGLREKCHSRVREYRGESYVAAQICTESFFAEQIEPGMLEAKEAIETIFKQRRVSPIAWTVDLQVITDAEMDLRDIGWENYKSLRRAVLQATGRGTL